MTSEVRPFSPTPADNTPVNALNQALSLEIQANVTEQLIPLIESQSRAMRLYADDILKTYSKRLEESMKAKTTCLYVSVDNKPPVTLKQEAHPELGNILSILKTLKAQGLHDSVLLYGPRGSGKSTIARQVAESLALTLTEISCNGSMTPSTFTGRYSPVTLEYKTTPFVETVRNGGCIFLDEVNALDEQTSIVLNALLSSGQLMLPTGDWIALNKNCYIIAADNTNGLGATHEFTARNRQDGAFLDRFVSYEIGYSDHIDTVCCPNTSLKKYLQGIRDTLKEKKLNIQLSPRAMRRCLMMLELKQDTRALEMITCGWSETQISQSEISLKDLVKAFNKDKSPATPEALPF